MPGRVQPIDLGFFSTLASAASLGATARELGVTTAAVSKRLAQMEERLGISLIARTTRRMSLTPEGELYVGDVATNDGEIAVGWALDGHGILMRAEWDIDRHLRSGRLVQVLPQYHTPDADVHAVYPPRHQRSARVRAFVDSLTTVFAQQAGFAKR